MSRDELKEQLQQVNAAIAAILVGGQSYKIGDRQLTRANLADLKKMKDDLEDALGADDSIIGRRVGVGAFDRR